MTDIVITAAKRTPVGSFLGAFATTPAHELGRIAIEAALAQAGVAGEAVSEVILGQVLTAAQGQNPARQAAMAAGIPKEIPAWGVNQVCGSGLRAVALAAQAVRDGRRHDRRCGRAGIDVAERARPESARRHQDGRPPAGRYDDQGRADRRLQRLSHGDHRREPRRTISGDARRTGCEFSVASQNKAEAARGSGRFKDEIAPVTINGRKGDTIVTDDEYIRPGVTIDSVSGVRPAFKKDGTVTAANASGLNDGAAALVIMSRAEAEKRGTPILATIKSWASAGVDPSIMGIGPVPATRRALEKAGWELADLDLIEANEAFAAQALAVGKELGWDADKVNVNGGAIAIGHPIGASGARVLTTLIYEMQKRDAKKGLATLCIGGGMGIAMCLER